MAVQPSEGAPSLRQIALEPSTYVGQRVKVAGQFRGRNLYGDAPQGPGLSQWDFVLRGADAAVWVTGLRPRGKGFNLDVGARVDTGTWLETTGIVREGKGLVWIEGQQIALTKPTLETRNAEVPPIPQMGPPPEVIFSDPAEGEIDVPLRAPIRLQFSRDMNPDTFKGNVRWTFTTVDCRQRRVGTPREADRAGRVQIRPGQALSRDSVDARRFRHLPQRDPGTARRHRCDRRREAQALATDVCFRGAMKLLPCPTAETLGRRERMDLPGTNSAPLD